MLTRISTGPDSRNNRLGDHAGRGHPLSISKSQPKARHSPACQAVHRSIHAQALAFATCALTMNVS